MAEGLAAVSVLVVDDNPQMRTIIGAVLSGAGVRDITYADNGERALAVLGERQIDVIYLDHEMPRMNGLQTLAALRRMPEPLRYTAVIMVTGHSDIIRIQKARDHGANEFLGKPVSATNLLKRLEAVIMAPRPFYEAPAYFGPDRRRKRAETGQKRRAADKVVTI